MKACLALRTSCRFQKFAVGDFRRTQVNGRERWVYLGKFYDLGSELAAYHAAQEKLSALPFVLRQGGAWTVLVDEGSVAPAAVVDPIGLAPPSSFAAALSMLPYILSKEEELSLIEYAKLRLAAIQADFARAAAPAVLDLPPELPETQGADAALPPEGILNQAQLLLFAEDIRQHGKRSGKA